MIPTGSKLWFGVAGFAVVATVVYFLASGGEGVGSMVLLALVLATLTLGLLLAFIGDGDATDPRVGEGVGEGADDGQGSAGTTVTAPHRLQLAASWPALAAVGAATAAVGLATGGILVFLGLVLIAAAGIEWMVQAWAEQATDEPVRNRELRNRLMYPFEIPVLAAVIIAVVIVGFSRVLLAVSQVGSTVVAIVVASVILGVAFLVTSRPRLTSSLLTVVVAVGAVALIGGGIVSAVVGERAFEVHEAEGGDEGGFVETLITASNTADYDEDQLNVAVGETVRIVFENNQGGVQHNVHIIEPEGAFEPGELIVGPATAVQDVTFEDEGSYTFVCDVYPSMEGVIQAVAQPADAGDGGSEEGES